MDAGIQAMDGNLTVVQVLHLSNVVLQGLPSLDAGFRHPCRNDGDFKSWLKQLTNQDGLLPSVVKPMKRKEKLQ